MCTYMCAYICKNKLKSNNSIFITSYSMIILNTEIYMD